jgi:signal recognition particle subunit SEC65
LEGLLTPVNIVVQDEFPVMSKSPKIDYYLLSHQGKRWTKAQKERLPDGIRDLETTRILIEFKYTESLSEKKLMKTIGYDCFFKEYQELKDDDMQTVVMSSKSSRGNLLKSCGYVESEKKGVYISTVPAFRHVNIILLNGLADTSYNAPYKLFAGRRVERDNAMLQLQKNEIILQSPRLEPIIEFVYYNLANPGMEEEMRKMTKEELVRKSKKLMEAYWRNVSPEERAPFWNSISPEERLKGLPLEVRLKGLPPEARLKGLPPEARLKGLPLEERLKGIPQEEIMNYIVAKKEAGVNP